MMTRSARVFLLLFFILNHSFVNLAQAISVSKLITTNWLAPNADCLNKSLSMIHRKNLIPAEEAKLVGAAHYNDQIFKEYRDHTPESWAEELEKTVDHFAAYDGKFNSVSFKRWLKENPTTPKPKTTIGSYLNKQNESFLKKYPDGKIEDLVAEVPGELRTIAKECVKDVDCHQRKIGALISSKFNQTCISKFKSEALKSMITGLALTNAGYGLSTAKNPENGYPFDLMATNLIWTPIMAELGCRNTLQKGSIGRKIEFGQKVVFSTENAKTKFNNYVNYMILSPLSDATYVGFHTALQVANGKKEWKDVHIWDLTKQVASLTLWDAIYPVPRMIFITDPFYLKGLPAIGRGYQKLLPTKIASGATYLTDWGSRVGLSFVNTNLVNLWINGSDRWWDTKFKSGKAPTDKPVEAPTAPEEKNEHDTIPNF